MMSGRPLMLNASLSRKLNLPSIIDDEEMTRPPQVAGQQPEDRPSYITFFFYAIKLIQIAGDILEAIYRVPDNAEGDEDVDVATYQHLPSSGSRLLQKARDGDFHEILQLDTALTRWHDNLPPILRISSHTSSVEAYQRADNEMDSIPYRLRTILARQAKVLEVRYTPQ